jgi:NADH:ubiquinone oxidoreductase subunit C
VSELVTRIAAVEGVTAFEGEDDLARGCQHQYNAPSAAIRNVAQCFREAGYHLEHASCLDLRTDDGGGMRLVYQFNRHGAPDRHLVLIDLVSDAHGTSIRDIFAGADWYEREIYDMHGVVIDGHPDLRRLLMPENYTGHPLLKDFRDEDAQREVFAAPMPAEEVAADGEDAGANA